VLGYFYFFVSIGDDVLVSVSSYLSILPVVVYSNAESEKETAIKENKNNSVLLTFQISRLFRCPNHLL
jgi:hypothetical protein